MKTKQNYKIEYSYMTIDTFLEQLKLVCSSISTFKSGIGEMHISLIGNYDGDCTENIVTVSDIFHDFRKDGIKLLKEYDRKQSPQKHWLGAWVDIHPIYNNPLDGIEAF